MDKEEIIQLTKELYRLTVLFPKIEPLRCKIRETADDILVGFIMARKENAERTLRENLEIIESFFEVARDQNWVSPVALLEIQGKYAKIAKELEEQERNRDAAARGFESEEKNMVERKKGAGEEIEKRSGEVGQTATKTAAEKTEEQKYTTASIQVSNFVPLISTTRPAQAFAGTDGKETEEEREGDEEKGGLTSGQAVRQQRIIEYLKEKGQAQVWEIQKIFPDISKRTIRRDFRLLLKQGLIERVGERNKTYYKLKINIS
jgi:hypothetical protein